MTYYDPYDADIDADPYPVWRALRETAPLYRNERYDFYALSRFDDVEQCSLDWQTYSSGRGTLLELIKADFEIPPGLILFEDPPAHDLHRGLLRRVFTPRRMLELEPMIRALSARLLDPFVGAAELDLIADFGAVMPMRVIGALLGIPEADQQALRDKLDAGMRLETSGVASPTIDDYAGDFGAYIDWRASHPSDDLMTELLNAEFEDETGAVRRLTRTEVLNYVGLIAGAGNETTTRLIGWAGYVLAQHPDQRALLAADPSLVPGAVEELLRYESPSPVQARYVTRDVTHYGVDVPAGSTMLLLTGAANRDDRVFSDPDRFDVRRQVDRHLAFGHGIHFCLGSYLARLEGRVALEELLRRFPTWEVDVDRAARAHTSTVRGWEKLPLLLR